MSWDKKKKGTVSLSLDGRGQGEGEAATPPPGLLPQGEKESTDAECLNSRNDLKIRGIYSRRQISYH